MIQVVQNDEVATKSSRNKKRPVPKTSISLSDTESVNIDDEMLLTLLLGRFLPVFCFRESSLSDEPTLSYSALLYPAR